MWSQYFKNSLLNAALFGSGAIWDVYMLIWCTISRLHQDGGQILKLLKIHVSWIFNIYAIGIYNYIKMY